MPTLGHIYFGTRARATKRWNFSRHFSRRRIEVNSASCKRTSEKRFEILRQFATEYKRFFDCLLRTLPIWLQSWSKNAKFEWEFVLYVGFVEKKITLVTWFGQYPKTTWIVWKFKLFFEILFNILTEIWSSVLNKIYHFYSRHQLNDTPIDL